jgi:hypothetical protein
MSIRKIIREEIDSFDWAKDVPTALDWDREYHWGEMESFFEDKFKNTRFEIRIDDNRMSIEDEEGTYHDWDMDERDTVTIGDILNPIKYTCDHYDGGREIRDEYRELYNTIVGYEHYPTGPLAESFDWAEDIPDTLTVGEIKQKFGGFRDYFSLGDIVEVKGSIPCESLRNEGCVINLSNSQYEVTAVLRTRMAIKPLDPDMLEAFEDEWGDDGHSKVYIGVENGDDDLYVHRISSELTESFDWAEDIPTEPAIGSVFKYWDGRDNSILKVEDISTLDDGSKVIHVSLYTMDNKFDVETSFHLKDIMRLLKMGHLTPIIKNL